MPDKGGTKVGSRRDITGVFEKPLGSNKWHIEYRDENHHKRQETPKPPTQKTAIALYYRRIGEVEDRRRHPEPVAQPVQPVKPIKFRELAEEFMAYRQGRVAELTYASDSWRLRILIEELGNELVDKIDGRRLVQLFVKLRKSRGGKTMNRYRALLSVIFKHGITTSRLDRNPIEAIEHYKEGKGRKRHWDEEEEAAVRKAMRERYPGLEAEIDLALYTGIRRGGIFKAKWSDVDFTAKIITIHNKGGEAHEVYLNDLAICALRELHARSGGSSYVIPAGATAKRDWRRHFEKCVKIAGVENFRYHDLRHTWGSRAAMRNVPLIDIQQNLGHKDIGTTMKYAHLSPSHHREMMERAVKSEQKAEGDLKATSEVVVISKKEEVV